MVISSFIIELGAEIPPSSFFQLFLLWSKSFQGYHLADVMALHSWWTQLESWCRENAPQVLSTLNPPASEKDLAAANAGIETIILGTSRPPSIPYLLRLMYRFHDGQQELLGRNEVRRRAPVTTDSTVCLVLSITNSF